MLNLPRGVRGLVVAAKCALAAGLFVYLVRSGRLDLAALAAGRGPGFHVLGVVLVATGVLLQSVRWWRLLAIQGVSLPVLTVLRVNWIGYFYASLLPGIGGGDLVRGLYMLREAAGARVRAASTILADRGLGLYASLCLGAVAVAGAGALHRDPATGLKEIGLTVVALFATVTAVAGVLLWRRSRDLVRRAIPARVEAPFAAAMEAYVASPRGLALCLALSLGSQALFLTAFLVAARALRLDLSVAQAFLVVPLVFIANALPLAPGGLGVGETAAAVLFAACGVEGGAALMLTVRVWQVVARLPGLLFQALGSGVRRPGPAEEAPAKPTTTRASSGDPPPQNEQR